MSGRKPYPMTMAELRRNCPGLASIEVVGFGPQYQCSGPSTPGTEAIVGKDAAGTVVIRVKGKATPANVEKFSNEYQRAVAAGIIKTPRRE